ncbi:uncharacterized protein Z520_01908 [Fonsecaea multimorphosa CBS 102226]|uniref:Uncharacterized protein n=1 Tax=Fonsecaea multimorphosa CBS 102226 TaxID=1442371 RepID=A0A0D2KEK3_9EURO|nr:uncharacterized protein Z520_01908 [Fonsecaea multimorphosa CBS 102226]KIY01770.1 hypothetical protein Z520_01908 [Fonsecaea multimorphosa CBS 102226]OAL29964.1 hypothetical protein AYO22_01870 [Fonsecaea multimorphosa]
MAFGFETTGNEIVDTFRDQVKGKTFLITGPTPGGIGAESALCLARARPKHLILAGRSKQKIQPLISQVQEIDPSVKTSFIQLDLGSQKSVRQAVEDVKALLLSEDDKIDCVILNAAIMACPYALTEDGIETQFGTNHLGHFLFCNLLLKNGLIRSRVVIVSSSASERMAEYALQPLGDPSYDHGRAYDPMQAYTFSKACGVLYGKRLARLLRQRHHDISVFSLNPGSIRTNLQGHMLADADMRSKAIKVARRYNPEFKIPEPKTLQQGCATQLRAALDPSLATDSGAYLDDCQVAKVGVHEGHEQYIDQVWELSERLVGETFEF